jgi:cytochrome d ubiquinol oxidase subunit I
MGVAASVAAPDLLYARQQMALSLGWHIVIACTGMAFPFLAVFAEWRGQRTGDPVYTALARHWSKVLAVLFAIGAVSGTILSFEFGILWPRWMATYGDVMGLPFAIEGFAFFAEAIFVGIYLYGWDRLPPRVHLWTGVPIGIAGVASAFFVVAANGFMNTPAGFRLVDGKPVEVHPWTALFNTSLWPEATHMILAAFIVTGYLVAMPHALALMRGSRERYRRIGFLIPFVVASAVVPLQIVAGPAAVVALESGWITTEVGRQPWIVYNIMRTRDAVSTASGLRYGYFLLIVIYAGLTVASAVVIRRLKPTAVETGREQ